MYRYEYVTIAGQGMISYKFPHARDTIDRCAAMGYRYVGFLPVNMDSNGRLKEIELVFEWQDQAPAQAAAEHR